MDTAIYWSDLADLTHQTQVEQFNFCTCEEQEYFPYADCPRLDFQHQQWENNTMDIYLEELAKTIALHDPNCECRDCAIYYLLAEEEEPNAQLVL